MTIGRNEDPPADSFGVDPASDVLGRASVEEEPFEEEPLTGEPFEDDPDEDGPAEEGVVTLMRNTVREGRTKGGRSALIRATAVAHAIPEIQLSIYLHYAPCESSLRFY